MSVQQASDSSPSDLKKRSLERWENEGGEIPAVSIPSVQSTSDTLDGKTLKRIVFDLAPLTENPARCQESRQ